ncbi:MAG: D-alanine--D-alanine ligase, partial [Deltaproteobacteria bacterium]
MNGVKKVAVLKGGPSLERQVSLRSGAHAQEALMRLGHEVLALDVGPELVPELRAVQALMEAIGIPYTGSGPAACASCTDKVLAKYLMREAGVPTLEFHFLREESIRHLGAAAAVADIEARLGFPLVVKPASQGSALGVKFARSSEELPGAMVGAFSYDDNILIERYAKGRDLAVSVLDGAADGAAASAPPGREGGAARGAPFALPVVEAVPREEAFYDYESRYQIGMTTFACPAELDAHTAARAQELALEVYGLLG